MQSKDSNPPTDRPPYTSASGPPGTPPPSTVSPVSPVSFDELVRIFNSALLTSRTKEPHDFSAELHQLMESPAFKMILQSVRQLARSQGTSEREAAEQMIETFRKIDRIWQEYVFREGVDRLLSK
jgi:hypothetical protein